jgi:hypothetical protein
MGPISPFFWDRFFFAGQDDSHYRPWSIVDRRRTSKKRDFKPTAGFITGDLTVSGPEIDIETILILRLSLDFWI